VLTHPMAILPATLGTLILALGTVIALEARALTRVVAETAPFARAYAFASRPVKVSAVACTGTSNLVTRAPAVAGIMDSSWASLATVCPVPSFLAHAMSIDGTAGAAPGARVGRAAGTGVLACSAKVSGLAMTNTSLATGTTLPSAVAGIACPARAFIGTSVAVVAGSAIAVAIRSTHALRRVAVDLVASLALE